MISTLEKLLKPKKNSRKATRKRLN
jgi:hypothetical protein